MSKLIEQFKADCEAAGISPIKIIEATGQHRSVWYRWENGDRSPTLESFEKAREELDRMKPKKKPRVPQYGQSGAASFDPYLGQQEAHHARLDFDKAEEVGTVEALAAWAQSWGRRIVDNLWSQAK